VEDDEQLVRHCLGMSAGKIRDKYRVMANQVLKEREKFRIERAKKNRNKNQVANAEEGNAVQMANFDIPRVVDTETGSIEAGTTLRDLLSTIQRRRMAEQFEIILFNYF
jgi:hypothetical protein